MQNIKGVLLIYCLLVSRILFAQDSTYVLSANRFNKEGYLELPKTSEWRFKAGNDTAWANPNFDHSQWQRLDSLDLMSLNVDDRGVFEGWFILTIRLDTSFTNTPLYLKLHNGSPADIYVNGKYQCSFGNTDLKSGKYRGYHRDLDIPPKVTLPTNQELLVAIHFVEYQETLYQYSVFANGGNIVNFSLLSIINEQAFLETFERIRNYEVMRFSESAALLVFIILFWLIAFLNRSQAHLIYSAIIVTLLFLVNVIDYLNSTVNSLTSNQAAIISSSNPPTIIFLFITFVYLIATILEVSINRYIKIFTTIIALFSLFVFFVPLIISNTYLFGSILFCIILITYYLIKYRRSLKGSKRIIIIGPIIMLLIISFQVTITAMFGVNILEDYADLITFIIPLNLLFFIAFWLKEMVRNIEIKAQELVLISNEKREILQNQNVVLEQQVLERTESLKASLENLKATQSQLIQSEKMASLGELTAGIAHEIQNPLNFVNNFSEVSNELIDEMKVELATGNREQATEIANDLKQNLEKINHHGKRADAIVKGMLQHSRTSSGKKELTDINALCDEYIRLAYHGLRAKDKTFNAKFETHLDPSLPKVNVVAQDIGRVILNLINNAFYAVNEKWKVESGKSERYEPTVTISTSLGDSITGIKDIIKITVKDNGNGIPDSIKEKIFQPFFTTKPTGQGTGLGLSLSYDIITKGHEGQLRVTSGEGQGSEFIITLPIK